jgi:hypothetical protein
MITRNYRTAKGTELPLLNLRGKEYLEVKYRLVWFREDHPDWSIETELINVTDVSAYARASIRDESGRIIATSHKFERIQGFPDFIEKAETGAIGRALALIGYGTQFCADELDEGQRIVDAPVQVRSRRSENAGDSQKSNGDEAQDVTDSASAAAESGEPGDYTINFGRKYKGKRLKEIPRSEIEGYIKWLETSDVKPGTSLFYQVEHLKNAFNRMYSAEATPSASH